MPESKDKDNRPRIEIIPSNPELWETEDQNSLLGFFKLCLEIDFRNNPENYKLNSTNSTNQNNSKSYETKDIRNSDNTHKAK
jgi:hypothetical protein